MDILSSFERHWFLISVTMLVLVYYFGLVTELQTVLPTVTQLFYAATGRKPNGDFAGYPKSPN